MPRFIVLCRYCIFFYKLKVRGNPALLSKAVDAIFPKAFVHFMPFGHNLVILEMCQIFSLLITFVIVICDQYDSLKAWLMYFQQNILIMVCTLGFQTKCCCTHNRLQYKHNFYSLGNQKICFTCFIAIFALLQWSGIEPPIAGSYACKMYMWCS